MEKPVLSDKFTLDDIHKIREYNYEVTKNMTFEEQAEYVKRGAEAALKQMKSMKATRK